MLAKRAAISYLGREVPEKTWQEDAWNKALGTGANNAWDRSYPMLTYMDMACLSI